MSTLIVNDALGTFESGAVGPDPGDAPTDPYMLTYDQARKSVSAADVKKFERFQASMKAR